MGVTGRCPRHPSYPAGECAACERLFDHEFERGACEPPEFPHPDQDRYERWLGEIVP